MSNTMPSGLSRIRSGALDQSKQLSELRDAIAQQRKPLPRGNEEVNLVVAGSSVEWYTPPGTNPSRLGPVLGLPIRSFELWLQEMPPGGSSDMQQHHHEAVHCILSGIGHSEIGSRTVTWVTGDFVAVPPMEWHRHYNGSESNPVRMLLVENSKLLEYLGLNYRASAGLLNYAELSASWAPSPTA
jgi:mannose-6-phosphate isomerase-like protein (cupin superfamily)